MALTREAIEWCQFRWNGTQDKKLPRVLLIGDSIVGGYWEHVTRKLAGKVTVAYFATSKCVGDPDYDHELRYALNGYTWALVYFNNGLHGLSADEAEYAKGMRKVVKLVLTLAGPAQVMWRSSTPITLGGQPEQFDPEKNARILERNRLAAEIMKENQIPVDDLYAVVAGHAAICLGDGYHYNAAGQEVLGNHVAKTICNVLNIKE